MKQSFDPVFTYVTIFFLQSRPGLKSIDKVCTYVTMFILQSRLG